MNTPGVPVRWVPVLLLLLLPGCMGLGLEDILSAGGIHGAREVRGEVRGVDTRRQEIQINSAWGGTQRVRYDSRTTVRYGQRSYRVRDLERGDLIRARLETDRRGQAYARYVDVEQSVRERRGDSGWRMQRVDGTITYIDTQRGWLELRPSRGPVLSVVLPHDPPRSLRDRFRRLRRGQRVQMEGYQVGQSTFEVQRIL